MTRLSAQKLAALLALPAVPALVREFKVGDIGNKRPWSRATPNGVEVAAGHLAIHSQRIVAEKLVGAAIVSFQVDGAGDEAPDGAGKTENGTKGMKV
jgi:copper(I)-binding protein